MVVRSLIAARNALTKFLVCLVIVAFAVLVLDVLWGVISRFVGQSVVWFTTEKGWALPAWLPRGQSQWTEELAIILLIWVSLLGAAVAFSDRSHLGVDYFVGKLDPPARRWIDVVVQFIILFFAASIMVWGGFILVRDTLLAEQVTPALNMPVGYQYLAVPISGVFVILYCIEAIVEQVLGIEHRDLDQENQ
ncbi:MAG: TRAP transporter small permease [Sedimentisphaerales bacterium]|nr:TRAP transporter small permease [Sedimentisphaerales bacterium]